MNDLDTASLIALNFSLQLRNKILPNFKQKSSPVERSVDKSVKLINRFRDTHNNNLHQILHWDDQFGQSVPTTSNLIKVVTTTDLFYTWGITGLVEKLLSIILIMLAEVTYFNLKTGVILFSPREIQTLLFNLKDIYVIEYLRPLYGQDAVAKN